MAIDPERELVRYFEWVETQAGSCLHRDPATAGHTALAEGGGADEIRSLEWRLLQPDAEPPHDRRSLVMVAVMVAAVCLPVGVVVAVLLRADTTLTDDPSVTPSPTSLSTVPSTTTGVTSPTTSPSTPSAAVPVTVGAELFSVPASSLSLSSQYESMWGASDGVSFTADGSSVMAFAGNALTRIDATTGVPGTPTMLNQPGGTSAATRISRDGSHVYTGSGLVDTTTGVQIELADTRSDVRGEFSPTGDRIVMPITSRNGQGRADVFDTATGEVVLELATDDVAITWATWSPDGSKLMTQGAVGVTRIWDATTGDQLLELSDADSASSFSPDGTKVVTVGPSKRVRVRDADTGEQLALDEQLPAGSDPMAWFSPDGGTVVVTQTDPADANSEIVTSWNVSDGTLAGTIPVAAGNEFPPGAFAGDRVVILAADGSAEIWSIAGSTKLATIKPVSEAFISVGFSPDGNRLVALESDRTVRVWEIP